MSIKIIEQRLKEYACESQREELSALKEIVQEIALCALSRAGFFELAAFQGGSCLRIIHQLNRFSEDLDFILFNQSKFVWDSYLKALELEFSLYGLEFQSLDRSKANNAVKLAFLKDTSFGRVLLLKHPRRPSDKQSIIIKLEIDTNPPAESDFTRHFIEFPYGFSIVAQDLPSLFASKCHALLCRPYTKGRDWFDFIWYVSKKIVPNYRHLNEALMQVGPWKGQSNVITAQWLAEKLKDRIVAIDWLLARQDASNFLRNHEQEGLKVWGNDYFLSLVDKFVSA